jgi:hypothetical protein
MPIKLFISHSSADELLASALVDCILASVSIEDDEVRCTSVAGHRLPVGSDFAATLKGDIGVSSAVIGLLTQRAISSSWVLFELGATWGGKKHLMPLLSDEVDIKTLPGPLASRHVARLSDVNDLAQFLDELAKIVRRPMRSPAKVTRAIDVLKKAHAQYLREHVPIPTQASTSSPKRPISVNIEREALRFGITLGWQLARYEFAYDSSFPEALAIAPKLASDIARALKLDKFPDDVSGLSYHDLLDSILSYYSVTSIGKHAAILLGVASMRATLVGASSAKEANQQMEGLAYSALADADPSALPDKDTLFQELLQRKPNSVSGVLSLLDDVTGIPRT